MSYAVKAISLSECEGILLSVLVSDDSIYSLTTSIKKIEKIKKEIYIYLEAIDNDFFTTSCIISIAVSPGLSLKGLRKVSLLLTERDAKDLAKISYKVLFGKGNQKLVNQSVCKT